MPFRQICSVAELSTFSTELVKSRHHGVNLRCLLSPEIGHWMAAPTCPLWPIADNYKLNCAAERFRGYSPSASHCLWACVAIPRASAKVSTMSIPSIFPINLLRALGG